MHSSSVRRPSPQLVESIHDCGYLFSRFKENLKQTGHAGIIAIHFAHGEIPPREVAISVALFIRVVGKKLAGKIEGGYRSGPRDFFLLLVADGHYTGEMFQSDREVIRAELNSYSILSQMARRNDNGQGFAENIAIDGVFLTSRLDENADNALFRAFQELFGASPETAGGHDAERAEIAAIIEGGLVTPVFQPIFSMASGEVHGYEALSRMAAPGSVMNTEELFDRAQRHGLTFPLEMLCRRKALLAVREQAVPGRIFINVCPTLLQAESHERGITAALLEELGIGRSRIVFELTERTLITDYELFLRVIAHYREQGYSIAIDDLGAGYAGLKMLARLEPDYVKLARFLVAGIDGSPTKQALVEALVMFCSRIGATVIAEGIERPEEYAFLAQAGVALGQGYLLALPSAGPLSPADGDENSRNIFLPATRT
jgi:EAL domain-containing protein (putative c-di-GMP-specific phosphodiesterase class I)